jgi:phospholipase C
MGGARGNRHIGAAATSEPTSPHPPARGAWFRPVSRNLGKGLGILAVTAVLLLAQSFAAEGKVVGATPTKPTELQSFSSHIKHIVVVMMENHAFDNYYGTYCQVTGPYCPSIVSGIPNGTCVPEHPHRAPTPCIRPFAFTDANWSVHSAMLHGYNSTIGSWDNGSMDGFYHAEDAGMDPFGYYDGSTIPTFWDLAEEYGLGDDFFSTAQSYSLANHWDLVAGQAPVEILVHGLEGKRQTGTGNKSLYLSEAQNTTSIEDLLALHPNVTWKYYDYALTTWAKMSNLSEPGGPSSMDAFDYWNPQAAKQESYGPSMSSNFVGGNQFFSDAQNGTLPDLSWLIPFFPESDHPAANTTTAESWIASVVNSVESSPDWNSTALFITFDEYGGFYDNVPPPVVGGVQLSFRVPLIVVSPYVHAGTVVPHLGDFGSLLRLMEWRFGLGCIASIDCNAPLPLGYFEFNGAPRAPMLFTTNPLNATYPIPLQKRNAPWAPVKFTASSAYTVYPANPPPFVD